jgi:hypothetical protein
MNAILAIIHLTLVSLAQAIFNISFIVAIGIVYMLINKFNSTNIYNLEYSKGKVTNLVEAILQGIIVGIFGSLIMIFLGLPINLTAYLIFLLPISLMLSLINIRYICFSYSASIMGLLALIFHGQKFMGINLPNVDINISGLLALVGILHLMEAILIFFVGSDNPIPIMSKKDDEIVMGHIIQKYWPIPLAILVMTSESATGGVVQMPSWWPLLKEISFISKPYFYGVMPIIGALGYSSISFAEEPEIRTKKTAILLFIYSTLLIIISIFMEDRLWLKVVGIISMAAIHEGIMIIEQHIEIVSPPIYTIPSNGIRIMHVVEGGIAEKIGLRRGDIIKKINDIEIKNINGYRQIINNKYKFICLEIENIRGEVHTMEYEVYPRGIDRLGIKLMPENPRILFRYDNIRKVGMIHLIKNKYKKR